MNRAIEVPISRQVVATSVLRWTTFACDAGNRTIKSFDEMNRLYHTSSIVKFLSEFDEVHPDRQSIICDYLDGNPDLLNKRWVVGKAAQDLAGEPTFEREKAELSPYLVLPMIQPVEEQRQIVIERLVCCLPNHRQQEKAEVIQKSLTGIHQYHRNHELMTVQVKAVVVEPETLGAYRYCMSQQLFQYARPNGILDLGGKTGIGQIYTANGSTPADGRVIVPGSFDLALRCSKHPDLQKLDFSPNLTLIMDAIADGSYVYGTTGVSFANRFPEYRDSWIADIRNKLKIGWAKWLSDLGEVVIVGGSAPLAQLLVEATKKRFKVCDRSQFANVIGMRTSK
ncbi:hypothetical protein LEP3755_36020 [Leptolyngbya sp. NIES-3755]|nr:hypothetical protein LEP3755_36020 [Leptolyngbya sp. NIES-3755]